MDILQALVFGYRAFKSKKGDDLIELSGVNLTTFQGFTRIIDKQLFDKFEVETLLYSRENPYAVKFSLSGDGFSRKIDEIGQGAEVDIKIK